jgi:hypothetical protein
MPTPSCVYDSNLFTTTGCIQERQRLVIHGVNGEPQSCILTAPVQADEHASVLESLRDLRIIHSLV